MSSPLLLPLVLFGVTVSILVRGWRARLRLDLRSRVLDLLGVACRRGVPLPPLLEAAAREHEGAAGRALARLHRAVEDGASLAEGLERAGPGWFGPHVVEALRAAEGTPRTGETLAALAEEDGHDLDARHRLQLALLYPALLVLLAASVHGVVSHRFMGEWSAGSGPRSIAVVTGTSLALLAAATWIVSYTLRRLRLRPFGRTVCLARALRLTGIFTASGLPAPAALRRAAQASSHRRVAHGLGAVAARLEAGEVSADAWAPLALPQALTLRLGAMRPRDLGGTLADLAQRLAARHHRRQDRMLRWVQPASVLVVAGAVLLEYSVVIDVIETARDAARLW